MTGTIPGLKVMAAGQRRRLAARAHPRAAPPSPGPRRAHHIACGGFTLAEVLAALFFMAIVIPVAVQGVRIAAQAGLVAQRKNGALRHAERLLNEALVTGQLQTAVQAGTIEERGQVYQWHLRVEPWDQGILQLATVRVVFLVQGQDYDVRLSTVVDTSTQ